MTDVISNVPNVEAQVAALSITDSIYHDEEPGYVIKALTDVAIAKGIVLFNATTAGHQLFELADVLRGAASKGEQFSLVIGPPYERDLPDALTEKIPSSVKDSIDLLGLVFELEPQRPSVISLFDIQFDEREEP